MLITLVKIFWREPKVCTNFALAHLGGFAMGLLVGTFFYPVISETKRHRTIMWGFRLAVLPLAIVLFVVLTRNFYTADPYAGLCLLPSA